MKPKPPLGARREEIERWWVVFCDGDVGRPHWWDAFTRPGFRHCYAFRCLAPDVTMVIAPMVHRIEQGLVGRMPAALIELAKSGGSRVLVVERVVSEYDPARDGLVPRGPVITCATVLAYLIGVPFAWRFTPWQLWKQLLRHGAEEV